MKQTVYLLMLLFSSYVAVGFADVKESISYFPVVTGKDIPEATRQSLLAKMSKLAADNGYGAEKEAERFVMLAKCNVVERDVAPTTPPRISQTVEITFVIGDVIEDKTFASTSFELKGIGTNETKAWQTAVNCLKLNNTRLHAMFEDAEKKISDYYSANCRNIIQQAQAYAEMGEYERAIASLLSVPEICGDCCRQAQTEAVTIYGRMKNAEGEELLAKAKNAWALSPDFSGAQRAMNYVNSIPVESDAYVSAEKLVETISGKLSSDKEREWQQRVKEYNDNLQMRKTQSNRQHKERMASIAAARSVAEKWAENQPETKIYLNW